MVLGKYFRKKNWRRFRLTKQTSGANLIKPVSSKITKTNLHNLVNFTYVCKYGQSKFKMNIYNTQTNWNMLVFGWKFVKKIMLKNMWNVFWPKWSFCKIGSWSWVRSEKWKLDGVQSPDIKNERCRGSVSAVPTRSARLFSVQVTKIGQKNTKWPPNVPEFR
jgi:hypothetical protein